MKQRALIRLAGAGAMACIGFIGFSTSVAQGAPAVHPDPQGALIFPSPDPTGVLPPLDTPGCPSWLFPDLGANPPSGNAVGFVFDSGNAVFYRTTNPPPGLPSNGGNVEGTADLVTFFQSDLTNPAQLPTSALDPSVVDQGYTGQAHFWFGNNINPNNTGPGGKNLQSYFGETIQFHGTAPDGSTITITGNPGGNISASGNENSWGHAKVTCTPPTQ